MPVGFGHCTKLFKIKWFIQLSSRSTWMAWFLVILCLQVSFHDVNAQFRLFSEASSSDTDPNTTDQFTSPSMSDVTSEYLERDTTVANTSSPASPTDASSQAATTLSARNLTSQAANDSITSELLTTQPVSVVTSADLGIGTLVTTATSAPVNPTDNASEEANTTSTTESSTQVVTAAQETVTDTLSPNLNTSVALQAYWVETIISVPETTNVQSLEWRQNMERKLASLYNEALDREGIVYNGQFSSFSRRKKRYATVQKSTIQVTVVTRASYPEDPRLVTIYYYMVEGNLDPNNYYEQINTASRVVYLANFLSTQEFAMNLGYVVVTKAQVPTLYTMAERLTTILTDAVNRARSNTSYYWVIGVVLGGVVLLAVLIWLGLFIFYKMTRLPIEHTPAHNASHVEAPPPPLHNEMKNAPNGVGEHNTSEEPPEGRVSKQNSYDFEDAQEEKDHYFDKTLIGDKKRHKAKPGKPILSVENEVVKSIAAPNYSTSKSRSKTKKSKSRRKSSGAGESLEEVRPTRMTTHPIRLSNPDGGPQIIGLTISEEEAARQQQEEAQSLRDKSDIERWRNKQRQRQRNKDRKQKRKPKNKANTYEVSNATAVNGIGEVGDMFGPDQAIYRKVQPRSTAEQRRHQDDGYSQFERLESDDDEEVDDEKRRKITNLLDDALTLVNKLSGEKKLHRDEDGGQVEILEDLGQKHKLMYINRVAKVTPAINDECDEDSFSNSNASSNKHQRVKKHAGNKNMSNSKSESHTNQNYDYTRAPETIHSRTRTLEDVAKALQPVDYTSINMDSRDFAPETYRQLKEQNFAKKGKPDATNPSYGSPPEGKGSYIIDKNQENPQLQHLNQSTPSIGIHKSANDFSESRPLPPYHHRPSSSYETSSVNRQGKERKHDEQKTKPFSKYPGKVKREQKTSSHSSSFENDNSDSKPRSKAWSGDFPGTSTQKKTYPKEDDEDELDVIDRVMQPGASSTPLLSSIRGELMKLASKTGSDDTADIIATRYDV